MEGIRRMIHQRLHQRAALEPPLIPGSHLDEDTLAAYTEARLSQEEESPVIAHLVACRGCRRVTTDLVRLEEKLGPEDMQPDSSSDGSRLKRLLKDLASRV